MYLGVDVGGSKTLFAVFNDQGEISHKLKIPTEKLYPDQIKLIKKTVPELGDFDFQAGAIAIPGRIDRANGVALDCGNLPWHDVPVQRDLERILNCPIIVENDANLGGLSESMLLPEDSRLLYVTVSTGIGTGFIVNQRIDENMQDSEGGQMLFDFHGKRTIWEDFASGKAIVERFGKRAVDIKDERTWRRIAHDLAQGFLELIAVTQPDIIAVGGSVGIYLERFQPFLMEELNRYKNPLAPIPAIQKAARPDDAVIYGCYDIVRIRYGKDN